MAFSLHLARFIQSATREKMPNKTQQLWCLDTDTVNVETQASGRREFSQILSRTYCYVSLQQTVHSIQRISSRNLCVLLKLYFSVKYVENINSHLRDETILTIAVFWLMILFKSQHDTTPRNLKIVAASKCQGVKISACCWMCCRRRYQSIVYHLETHQQWPRFKICHCMIV
jgi:hypothetical protein